MVLAPTCADDFQGLRTRMPVENDGSKAAGAEFIEEVFRKKGP